MLFDNFLWIFFYNHNNSNSRFDELILKLFSYNKFEFVKWKKNHGNFKHNSNGELLWNVFIDSHFTWYVSSRHSHFAHTMQSIWKHAHFDEIISGDSLWKWNFLPFFLLHHMCLWDIFYCYLVRRGSVKCFFGIPTICAWFV